MQSFTIPDTAITASSTRIPYPGGDHVHSPECARLNFTTAPGSGGCNAWVREYNDYNAWIRVDLGENVEITEVVTQGGIQDGLDTYWGRLSGKTFAFRVFLLGYVSQFTIEFEPQPSVISLPYFEPLAETVRVFQANQDTTTPVSTVFSRAPIARYVKLYPAQRYNLGYQEAESLRLEFRGCRGIHFCLPGINISHVS
jgi:hypothetical protein